MRRAPSARGKDADALRFSVFDAAHQIGLSDPNALRWLEQNSNISEEDEEEEEGRPETRPPSDAHPPSLVFSSSSSEPDSSVASPSNDHSMNYRAPPYPRYHHHAHGQFASKQPPPNFHSSAQIVPESRSPLGPNVFNAPNPLSRLQIPAQKSSDPWPPTPLAIASLSPISQPASRAPTPGDKASAKPVPEAKKSKKLTKAPRGGESESESVPSRKGSASGASGNPNIIGSSGPPTLPSLPFPSAISGETLRSDASVSGLSVVSGMSASSTGTVTQSIFMSSRSSNEPRSVFEDDDSTRNSPIGGPSGHTHGSPSTSTANSNETPSTKDKEGKLLRTMRSFKLSLKSQKAKANTVDAPPVPNVPSLPPVLTLELDKGASLSGQLASTSPPGAEGASPQTKEKDREERVLKIAEMFTSELSRNTRSGSESGNVSSIYTTQSHSDVGHGVQSDIGHVPSNPPPTVEPPRPSHSDLGHAPIRIAGAPQNIPVKPVVARRRSVDESDPVVGEVIKATERTRAGTVGIRNGHARTRSKSGDFTGLGWERGGRPVVLPNINGNTVMPVPINPIATQRPVAKPPPTKRPPKPAPARRFFVTNPSRISTVTTASPPRNPSESSPASPIPPNPALSQVLALNGDSKHSLEREGFGTRGEQGDTQALEVQHQLQSFIASMRGTGEDDGESLENTFGRASTYEVRNSDEGSGRGSQDSRNPFNRIANDTDTVRSSGEYDPFRAQTAKLRPTPVTQPRPESEALPHQFHIPEHEIPKEILQVKNSLASAPAKRNIPAPPTSFRTPESELPSGLVRTSSISARPSVTVSQVSDRPMSADLMETTPISIISPEQPVKQNDAAVGHTRSDSKESELRLGYSGVGSTHDAATEPAATSPYASEEFIIPSPSWAPLELKRGRSGSVSATPNSTAPQDSHIPDAPTHPGQFLDVRADRQRASGLSIPRSVTPDSPRPSLVPPRSAMSPPRAPSALSDARSATPLAPSRSVTPIAPVRLAASPAPRAITPQPTRALSPQGRAASPALSRSQQRDRDTPSPPLPRNRLPTRTSSISSASSTDQSVNQRVRSPPPRNATLPSGPRPTMAPTSRFAAAPTSRPSTASTVQSVASTSSFGLPPRSTSVTPIPRDEPLPHEQSSRFLDPESIPAAQQRGRVSPFPVKPLRGRGGSRDQLKETEQPIQTQREKYPGGAEKHSGEGLVPRVRFIGVRSSNGSSQAGWQGRMEDMRHAESPAQLDRWQEEETRPVSWQEYEEPSYLSYDEEESTQGYYEGIRYSAYEDEPASGDTKNFMPVTPMDSEPSQDPESTLAPPRERPAWVLNDSSPASRESTFTLASVYDDEDEDVTPIPKGQKLAAAVRGMSQNGWASGRI